MQSYETILGGLDQPETLELSVLLKGTLAGAAQGLGSNPRPACLEPPLQQGGPC